MQKDVCAGLHRLFGEWVREILTGQAWWDEGCELLRGPKQQVSATNSASQAVGAWEILYGTHRTPLLHELLP